LVRNAVPSAAIRVLATSLTAQQTDATAFAALYHQRGRIEEAFKRLSQNPAVTPPPAVPEPA